MDPVAIGGIITALAGGVATVIMAIVALRKVTGKHDVLLAAAVAALRSLWDWVEFHGFQDQVPERIRRAVLNVLDRGTDETVDQ